MLGKRKQIQPPASMGVATSESGLDPVVRYVCTETGRLLSSDEARARGVSRVTTSLQSWTGETHGVFFEDIKVKRNPIPEYHELADHLVGIAERGGEQAQNVVGLGPGGRLKAFDFIRQHEATRLHITAAPSEDIDSALMSYASVWDGGPASAVEPRMHSVWRAARRAALDASPGATPESPLTVVAIALTGDGYGYAIGPSNCAAPIECTEEAAGTSSVSTISLGGENPLAIELVGVLSEKVTDTNFHDNNLSPDAEVVIYATAEGPLWEGLRAALRSDAPSLDVLALRTPDEARESVPSPPAELAAWGGALAGTADCQGYTADLRDPLKERAGRIRDNNRLEEQARLGTQRRATLAALLLLPLVVLGAAAGWWLALTQETSALSARQAREQQRSAELARYISWKENATQQYNYYYDLAKKITELRRKQPAPSQLLIDLDPLWPRGDQSWYVSGLAIPPNTTQVELRGRTRSRQAFGDFTAAMEIRASDTFDNILPTIGDLANGGAAAAASGNIGIGNTGGPRPDAAAKDAAFEWWLKFNYKPLGQSAKTPAQAAGPRPAFTSPQPPAAALSAAAAAANQGAR